MRTDYGDHLVSIDDDATVRLGRDVIATRTDRGGLELTSPHHAGTLLADVSSEFVLSDGRRVPQIPVLESLLAAGNGASRTLR